MDTLLAIVSPALFPTLERVLEVAFLTGFAHSWKLQATLMGQPNRALPNLTRRRRPVRKIKSGKDSPKALPNDPQRQGNIWHRYEQLENMTKSLAGVNQQMVMEKAKHQREKKRLEEALVELERVNTALITAAHADSAAGDKQGASPAVFAISADSAELLGELRSRPRSYCPVSGLERPVVPLLPQPAPETCVLQGKKQGEDTVEHAETVARLQGQLAATQEKAKKADDEAARLMVVLEQMQDLLASQATQLQAKVKQLEGKNAQLEATLAETQPADVVVSLERQVHALTAENEELRSGHVQSKNQAQADDLEAAKKELQDKIVELDNQLQDMKDRNAEQAVALGRARAAAASASPEAALVRSLGEQNRALATRVAELEAAAGAAQPGSARAAGPAERSRELEEAHAAAVAENARLQAKIMRLSGTAPAVAAAGELLDQLRSENAALQSDNERLLSYMDTLNATGSGGLNSGTPRGHRKLLENFVQLKSDNKLLAEENARLETELAEVQHARGGITTVPVPVRVEDGEAVDRELWVLLEELQERNQALASENTALRARPPTGSWAPSEAELASENERLHRQLSAVMEMRAAEINEDNLRLVNHLTEENGRLEQENAAAKGGDQTALQELLLNLERLRSNKSQVMLENAELAKKNTRLIEENEAMIARMNSEGGSSDGTRAAAARKPRRSLFRLRGSPSKSVQPVPLSEGEEWHAGDSPQSHTSSRGGGAAGTLKLGSVGSELDLFCTDNSRLAAENARLVAENKRLAEQANMVADLTNTNAHLTAENARLNDRMAKLVKDLTEENKQLLGENQRLNQTVKKVLEENAELTSRLIDVALTSSHNDVFDAAFGGEGTSQAGTLSQLPLGHWSQEEVQRRHKEATEELAAVGRQQAMRAQQRVELSHRASTELEAYENAKRSAEQAYSKSKALALQRLQSRNSQAAQSAGGTLPAGRPGQPLAAPSTPETADRSAAPEDGQFDEAMRRRKEADLSRVQLQQKIEAFKRRRGRQGEPDQDPPLPRAAAKVGDPVFEAAAARSRAEAAHRREMQRKEAEDRVRAAYFRYAGNHDVAAFMRALGFEMPAQPSSRIDASPLQLANKAIEVLQSGKQRDGTREQQLLVEAALHKLQQWSSDMHR
ncbi:g3931 [Coccomyxa elongata]